MELPSYSGSHRLGEFRCMDFQARQRPRVLDREALTMSTSEMLSKLSTCTSTPTGMAGPGVGHDKAVTIFSGTFIMGEINKSYTSSGAPESWKLWSFDHVNLTHRLASWNIPAKVSKGLNHSGDFEVMRFKGSILLWFHMLTKCRVRMEVKGQVSSKKQLTPQHEVSHFSLYLSHDFASSFIKEAIGSCLTMRKALLGNSTHNQSHVHVICQIHRWSNSKRNMLYQHGLKIIILWLLGRK